MENGFHLPHQQPLHAQHDQVQRLGIPLTKSLLGAKLYIRRKYRRSRKPKLKQSSTEEVPIQTVISLFQVKFKDHTPFLLFGFSHSMNNFLENNNIVHSPSLRNKTTLKKAYQALKKGSHPVH
ncbi:hypothetical protein AAZX31_08G152000 [Glycine max]